MRVVHLVTTVASLLSGGLQDCKNATDPSCQGGLAAVSAKLRHNVIDDEPTLVIPYADVRTPFVQMHPLGWSLNRLVCHYRFGWDLFMTPPSLLLSADSEVSSIDITDMQGTEFPYLLTNTAVPPDNSWHKFTKSVHFDHDTGLAIIALVYSDQPLLTDPLTSAMGILDFLARTNDKHGCTADSNNNSNPQEPNLLSQYIDRFNKTDTNFNNNLQQEQQQQPCWIPVIIFADNVEKWHPFLEAAVEYANPPAYIIEYFLGFDEFVQPQRVGSQGVWVSSYRSRGNGYYQHKLTLSPDQRSIERVDLISGDLTPLSVEEKDDQFVSDIEYLHSLALEATANDPIVGETGFMPDVRHNRTHRRCMAGECAMGNLFTDAMRWWADADVAFMGSGGLRGFGWPAGPVRISNLWSTLPFSNTQCTGVATGVSLFRIFNHSTTVAIFSDQNANNGDRLLQNSGMRVTYNTERKAARLVSMEFWEAENKSFIPMERLRLYKFVTDSYTCSGMNPFPELLRGALVFEGEEAAVVGEDLLQTIVTGYLRDRDDPYNTTLRGSLIDNTSSSEVLNMIQTEDSCPPGFYWKGDSFSCRKCPDSVLVNFLSDRVEFDGEAGSVGTLSGQIDLVNSDSGKVTVIPKTVASWITFVSVERSAATTPLSLDSPIQLEAGERLTLNIVIDPSELEAGTARATVSFSVSNSGNYLGCRGQDVSFEVFIRATPAEEQNHLGSIRFTGWILCGITIFTALFFAIWVYMNRKERVVLSLQPSFLVVICLGVLIMSLSIIPMSLDDSMVSLEGMDIACMAIPWLLGLGFTISFSCIFSKLWRINKLMNSPSLQRMQVREKDVLLAFSILFTLNLLFLLVWTFVSPLQWVRQEVEGQPWNTYGTCQSEDETTGNIMFGLVTAVNAFALFLACQQAYFARNLSDDFSESKPIGIALFSWAQLLLVGLPVAFLIDEDNPTARYFLFVSLVFAMCMSMLLLLFVPTFLLVQKKESRDSGYSTRADMRSSNFASGYGTPRRGTVHVSGLSRTISRKWGSVRSMFSKSSKTGESSRLAGLSQPEERRVSILPFIRVTEGEHDIKSSIKLNSLSDHNSSVEKPNKVGDVVRNLGDLDENDDSVLPESHISSRATFLHGNG